MVLPVDYTNAFLNMLFFQQLPPEKKADLSIRPTSQWDLNPYYHPHDDKDNILTGWGGIRDKARDVRVVAHMVAGGE